ncbi:MAG: NADH-quinone oxidoreductase subunit J family protein [Sulfobacillus sp.]
MIPFSILAVVAIAGALGVILGKQPVHSALFLVGNILALAVLYLLLSAEFLAVAQVIVYAGAIMVLFLFVVTLLTAGKEESEPPEDLSGQRWTAGILAIGVGGALAVLAADHPGPKVAAGLPVNFGNLHGIGHLLWGSDFLYLMALAIMLLTAALGILVLNRPMRRTRVRHQRRKEA